MGNTLLFLSLIVSIVALIILILVFIRSQQRHKDQQLMQLTWEQAQEIRHQKRREEHEQIVEQFEKRIANAEEQSHQKDLAHLKQVEDLKEHFKDQMKDQTQYYEGRIQHLTQHHEEQIKQLTIDYELTLLLHIEDVTLLQHDQEQKNRRPWRPSQLPDADLSGQDLSYRYLAQANLHNAVLINANLFMADLNGADLTNADLSGADLSATNLSNADLSGAILTDTNMLVADLKNANLLGANIEQARNLTEEQLAGSIPDQTQKMPRFQIPQEQP